MDRLPTWGEGGGSLEYHLHNAAISHTQNSRMLASIYERTCVCTATDDRDLALRLYIDSYGTPIDYNGAVFSATHNLFWTYRCRRCFKSVILLSLQQHPQYVHATKFAIYFRLCKQGRLCARTTLNAWRNGRLLATVRR